VTVVRPYVTKTGKPMGFATLEDIQGTIELVLFPRTWEKTREQLTVGQIVIVDGKVDTSNTPPKVLVDSVRTEIKVIDSVDGEMHHPSPQATQTKEPVRMPRAESSVRAPARQISEHSATAYAAPASVNPERAQGNSNAGDMEGVPPPPDNFPADWDKEWQPSFDNAAVAARQEPKPEEKLVEPPPIRQADASKSDIADRPPESNERETAVKPGQQKNLAVQPIEPARVEPPALPSLYVPLAQAEKDKDHPPKQITVILRSTGDKERDKLRIKTIYGTLISFHGRDRFSFQIFENGKGHLIDFPNDTTRICAEMLARLEKLIGEETWRVEEIKFQ
jgi:DNA polymerase III subunit alpha